MTKYASMMWRTITGVSALLGCVDCALHVLFLPFPYSCPTTSMAPMWPPPPINPPNLTSSEAMKMKPQPQPAASQLPASEWSVANRQASSGEWVDGRAVADR